LFDITYNFIKVCHWRFWILCAWL